MLAEIFMLRLEVMARAGGQGSGHHHQEHVSLRSGNLAAGEGVLKTLSRSSIRGDRPRTDGRPRRALARAFDIFASTEKPVP